MWPLGPYDLALGRNRRSQWLHPRFCPHRWAVLRSFKFHREPHSEPCESFLIPSSLFPPSCLPGECPPFLFPPQKQFRKPGLVLCLNRGDGSFPGLWVTCSSQSRLRNPLPWLSTHSFSSQSPSFVSLPLPLVSFLPQRCTVFLTLLSVSPTPLHAAGHKVRPLNLTDLPNS